MDNWTRDQQTSRRKRSRSRSPYRRPHKGRDHDVKRSRSRSPHRRSKHHHRDRDRSPRAQRLPFASRHLHKRDLESYRPLLVEYLDLQKHLDIRELSEDEVKGRWKSFVRKWNEGTLAEGWYDPEVRRKAEERNGGREAESVAQRRRDEVEENRPEQLLDRTAGGQGEVQQAQSEDSEDDDDGYGPALPDSAQKKGPSIPGLQDLQHRQELDREDAQARKADARYDRKQDLKQQKARLDELAPRADAGTRERQLEKRAATTSVHRSFADAKEGGADEVKDSDLMGADGDGVEGYKKAVREEQRKKSEREVRKEEVLRARAAEREERLRRGREKEERTMGFLRGLARERFGGGGGEEG